MIPAIQAALSHHQMGRLDLAEAAYRTILSANPKDANANHFLGMLLHSRGRCEEALTHLEKSVALAVNSWAFLNNLATVYMDLGRITEAIKHLDRAASLNKRSFEVINNLAKAQYLSGQFDLSISTYRRSLVLAPANAKTLAALSHVLLATTRVNDAENFARRALLSDAQCADAHSSLGAALLAKGDFMGARTSIQRAIELEPAAAGPKEAMGNCLAAIGQLRDAEAFLKEALAIEPRRASALSALAAVHILCRRFSDALTILDKLSPLSAHAVSTSSNRALCLHGLGKHNEAIECYRDALRLPHCPASVYSNYLLALLFADSVTGEEIWIEHQKFGRLYASSGGVQKLRHTNVPDANRKLRVGFVSADFRSHPVALFIEPIIRLIDKSQFELYAYHNQTAEDDVSTRLRQCFSHWVTCRFMRDEELATRIASDQIDVLFDLSGHTEQNRLSVFAIKPAPVQISWIGYPGTTGLDEMDYKITNAELDPEGAERHHSETLIRLPTLGAPFMAPENMPSIDAPPCLKTGKVTFGCLNNPAKITRKTATIWAQILERLPESRLMLSTGSDQAITNNLTDLFSSVGVDNSRLVFQPWKDLESYLRLHNEIDISLDPFPYNGGTSTFHSLSMGVPVVTLTGDRTVSRVGAAILKPLGLGEFIACSEAEYIEKAVVLALNRNSLVEHRVNLLKRLLHDPASDPEKITKHVESAIREAWKAWCEGKGPQLAN